MKKALILILSVLIFSFLLLYTFYFNSKKSILAIDIIPNSAIVVHEIIDPMYKWSELKKVFKNDSVLYINNLSRKIQIIDTILNNSLKNISENNKLVTSIHSISKRDVDFIFSIDISILDKKYLIQKLRNREYSIQKRVFNDYELYDIKSVNEIFTFLFYQNLFIGSQSSILIEDVVRVINDKKSSFKLNHLNLFEYVKIKNDYGNLYINTNKLQELLKVFVNENKFKLNSLNNFFDETFLDFSLDKNIISFNGFSSSYSNNKLTSFFKKNGGERFSFQKIIPNNTTWVYHISFHEEDNNTNNWKKILMLNSEKTRGKINDQILENFQNEFGLLKLEKNIKNEENELVIIKSKNIEIFNKIIKESNDDSKELFSEKYNNTTINKISNNPLISQLFDNPSNNPINTFYVTIDNYIIISNSISNIKEYLRKVEKQEVWSKSLYYNEIINNLNKESNINILINIPRTLIFFLDKINNNYKENLIDFFNNFSFLSLQLTKFENHFYTSLVLKKSKLSTKNSYTDYNINSDLKLILDNKIITKPNLIKSHIDNSIEVIVQDNHKNIYQISSEFQKIWKDSILSNINSKIYQIDYYKNNKKQIIFSTKNKIYAYDRKGNNLTEYPLKNPSNYEIEQFNIIDYDNSKNYRIVIADKMGNIYLKDKTGKNLEGWNPLKINDQLSEAPFHIRVSKKDYIIIVEKNGKLNVLNRKGKTYKGFPIDFESNITNNVFINNKTNQKNTTITLLLDNGKLVQVNLNGEIIKENQLYRPSIDSKFYLLIDPTKKNYKIIVRNQSSIQILENNETQFEKDFLNPENLNFQYYYFGGKNEAIAILDKKNKSIEIYIFEGNLVSKHKISSDQLISILYYESKKEFNIYSIVNNTLSIIKLKN